MKKKSASHSAFFNLRVLTGLFITLAGVSLALLGSGASSSPSGSSSAKAQQKYQPPIKVIDPTLLPAGFDCSKIHELGIDRQENFRAGLILIACGEAQGGSGPNVSFMSRLLQKLFAPLVYGGTDVDLITGAETSPHVTQSETFSWANPDNPNQIVVTYNDSRTASANYSGASYSSDGGLTFTRLNPSPFASGHGTNFGDPVVLYHRPSGTFHAIFIATGCGGQGIGDWTSTDGGVTWAVGACVANAPGGAGDRESGWSDMNPASPFYGRMYVSFNNFANAGPPISVVRSTDNGVTWSAPVNLPLGGASFVRDVQITGDQLTGDVYIAGMNEMGGGLGNRANMMYRSTDGGVTWALTYTGPAFAGPGSGLCSDNTYFATMFGPYWRHMGWGEPAAYNHVVHYVYAQHGAGADPGDVYYIRSTDSGATFSAPLKLNTDATITAQWQPNLSVNANGSLFAMWYDGRNGTGCSPGVNTPCYQMFGRKSTDNGATWQADMAFSDVVSPLPGQPDGTVVGCYAGDYDYGSAIASKHLSSWVDGRVLIGGASQQDAFTDRELAGPTPTASPTPTATATASPTPTPTPTCPPQYVITQIGGSIVPGTTDIGNHGDDQVTTIALPFPYTLYDQTFTMVNLSSNGNAQFTTTDAAFTNICLPWLTHNYTIFPYWDDLYLVNAGFGIFTSVSGTAPNRIFNIEWRAQYFPGSGSANYELMLYEGQTRFDVIYGTISNSNTSATAGVQRDDTIFTQYFCNGVGGAASGGQSYVLTPCQSPTPTPTAAGTATATATPTSTPTPTPTPVCTPSYTYTIGSGTFVPGTTSVGMNCDDCGVTIPLPFSVSLYGNTYTTATAGSNGHLTFGTAYNGFGITCMPETAPTFAIGPYWVDQYPVTATCPTCGVFTTTTGVSPNRTFYVEYRNAYYPGNPTPNLDYEVILYETPPSPGRYDVAYQLVTSHAGGTDSALTVGVQQDTTNFTEVGCDPTGTNPPAGVASGAYFIWTPTMCGTPTPTPTPTATCTPGWSAGAPLPTPGVRLVGVYFPPNGKFYAMGGRSSDAAGSDFTNPREYDPVANTWTVKAAVYPDNQVNNMACGVLTVGGTSYIYCVGGSAAGQVTATARVFFYDPVADSITSLTSADNWPGDAAGTILPGGFAVTGNKLYIVGGFNINVASTNQIWQFDPTGGVGSKWTQMMNTPEGVMYAATTAIGGIIFVGGASDFQGGALIDTTNSFSFNPSTNTIGAIAAIPRATGETRALNVNNQMWVMGGGRVAPNPSNEVDIYDPATNTWTIGAPFVTARRNFPTDTDGTCRIWLAGGYAPATPTDSMEIFCCGGGTPTPTPTASPTGTPSATPTATPTGTVAPTPTATATATATASATPTSTPTATPTCTPGGFSVLIAFADGAVQPDTLRNDLLAAGASVVDFFDAQSGTPTVGQLQQYQIVVPFSNFGYADPVTLGNNLDAYLASGGIVVAFNFSWFGGSQSIQGAWLSNGDTPFDNPGTGNFSNGTLGSCTFSPLCNGITTLNAFFREIMTVASGATQAATWNDGTPLIAYKGRAVGVSAYVGDFADNWSGQFAQVIMNAGSYLLPCGTPTPTPTASPSATATFTPTPTATATATFTPTPTATATFTPTPTATFTPTATATATATPTATVSPRPTPTPRPRPSTPPPRP